MRAANAIKTTNMLEQIIIIALIVTAIHVSMFDGMIFGGFRQRLDALFDKPALCRVSWLKKPLYSCNVCMGGIWTLIIYPPLYGIHWHVIPVLLGVIGANVIFAAIIKFIYYDSN